MDSRDTTSGQGGEQHRPSPTSIKRQHVLQQMEAKHVVAVRDEIEAFADDVEIEPSEEQPATSTKKRGTEEQPVTLTKKRRKVKRGMAGRFVRSADALANTDTVKMRREKDRSWFITGAIDGGPSVPDVIPSFGGHVAHTLWYTPELDRGLLKSYPRPSAIDTLRDWDLSSEAGATVYMSGLPHLSECMISPLDVPLLCAFVERWQPDTNTFHMPWGEMTILLHDVANILDIPIEGQVCGISPMDIKSPLTASCELFGMTPQELRGPFVTSLGIRPQIAMGGGVLGAALIKYTEAGSDELQAQGYLMYLLGSTLFLDKSSNRIMYSLASFVRHVDQVSKYAFGVGALAYLYRQLGISSRAGARTLSGCLPLLQSWIYAYFPAFRPSMGSRVVIPPPHTYAMQWMSLPKRRSGVDELVRIRRQLDSLTSTDVVWLPWGARPDIIHPRSTYSGPIRFVEMIEQYQPDRCLRQFGFIQIIPAPMPVPIEHYRPANLHSYILSYGDTPYADHMWATGHSRLDAAYKPASFPAEVAEGYMEWYRSRSHPLIVQSTTKDVPMPLAPDEERAQLGISIVQRLAPLFSGSADDSVAGWLAFRKEMEGAIRLFQGI